MPTAAKPPGQSSIISAPPSAVTRCHLDQRLRPQHVLLGGLLLLCNCTSVRTAGQLAHPVPILVFCFVLFPLFLSKTPVTLPIPGPFSHFLPGLHPCLVLHCPRGGLAGPNRSFLCSITARDPVSDGHPASLCWELLPRHTSSCLKIGNKISFVMVESEMPRSLGSNVRNFHLFSS